MKGNDACVVVGLALVVMLAGPPARAMRITIGPAQPTTADSVVVMVNGAVECACWVAGQTGCGALNPDTLAVTVPVAYRPDCRCTEVPVPYQATCPFGLLRAGNYVVAATELHAGSLDIAPTVIRFAQFTVATATTPMARRTWGAIKSAYR